MSDTKPQDDTGGALDAIALERLEDRIRRTELEIAKEAPKGRGGPGRGQGRKRELESSERKTYSLDWESRKVITAVQRRREERGEILDSRGLEWAIRPTGLTTASRAHDRAPLAK